MAVKGRTQSDTTRARISTGTRWAAERRKRIGRIAPGELLELQRSHTLSDSLNPYASLAVEEAFGLIQALGGDDNVILMHILRTGQEHDVRIDVALESNQLVENLLAALVEVPNRIVQHVEVIGFHTESADRGPCFVRAGIGR